MLKFSKSSFIPNARRKYPLTFKKSSLLLFLAFGITQIFRKRKITFARAGKGYISLPCFNKANLETVAQHKRWHRGTEKEGYWGFNKFIFKILNRNLNSHYDSILKILNIFPSVSLCLCGKSRLSFVGRVVAFLFILSLSACFEYEETITFKKGFSGSVEINYIVPLNHKSDNSVVKFLPIFEEDINNRINKGLFSKNIKIKEYTLKYLEKNEKEPNPLFQKKAKVSYKIDFHDLATLDGVLLGSLFVTKRSTNSISVKREFKSVLKPLDQTSTTGEKKILSETTRLLGNGFITFRVNFPLDSVCRSSKGEVSLGMLYYKLPLVDTVEKPGTKFWDYTITMLY